MGNDAIYWIIQFIAGIAAAALIAYLFGTASGVGATIGTLTNTNAWGAVLAEAVATFTFVIVVLIVTRKPLYSLIAGVAIGLSLGIAILAIEPLSGGSANPSRSLGPAIFSGNLGTYWIYLIGPLLGAFVAALVYRWFINDNCCNMVDECGDPILNECGKPIKQCTYPVVDNCGRQMYDECCEPIYRTQIVCP